MRRFISSSAFIVILSLVATLPLPNRDFPLSVERLKESLKDELILKRISIGVHGFFPDPVPYTYRLNEGKNPPIYHRGLGLAVIKTQEKFGQIGFMEGPMVHFPAGKALALLRQLVEIAISSNLLAIKNPPHRKPYDFSYTFIRITYWRPKTKGYITEREVAKLWVKPDDARVKEFLSIFYKEVLQFAEAALQSHPPKKVFTQPEKYPERFVLITELTEQQVKEIEKELAEARKSSPPPASSPSK